MSKKNVIPAYDPSSTVHKYIWDFLAYDLTNDDFEEIERILKNRKEDYERINRSDVLYTEFSHDPSMYQPRVVSQHIRDGAYRYADWSAATDILLILSKYTDMYSKTH